jgi:hypothetical protein
LVRVHKEARMPITIRTSAEGATGDLDRHLREAGPRRYDWSTPPLMRMQVETLDDNSFQLTFWNHHAIIDGWSVGIVLHELLAGYRAALRGEPWAPEVTNLSGKLFVAMQDELEQQEEARAHWDKLLAGYRSRDLRQPAPSPASGPAILERKISQSTLLGVRDLAKRAGAPLRTVLLAVHLRALTRITGHVDVATAVIANARLEVPGGDRMVGLLWNPVLHVQTVNEDWDELIRETFEIERDWTPYRAFPFARTDGSTRFGGNPYSDFAFNFVQVHLLDGDTELSDVVAYDPQNHTLFAAYKAHPRFESLRLSVGYDPNRIERERVSQYADEAELALSKLVARARGV